MNEGGPKISDYKNYKKFKNLFLVIKKIFSELNFKIVDASLNLSKLKKIL